MSSLPLSIGIYNPAHRLGSVTTRKPWIVQSSALKLDLNASISTPLSRREAVGIGLSFSLVQFLHPRTDAAAAESAAPDTCEYTAAPSGLAFCDKAIGTGPQPAKGQLIKAHYIGRLPDGKVFDSSYNRGKPLTFRVGVGEVIKGWDDGILGGEGIPPMLPGGKRKLKIPPALGYGMRGAGCKGGSCIIPPDSVLFFDVEFVGKA
ncbi:peptidyl-prolyl cis-trans isomerase FKBP13, chloroplastic-like [Salvia hispanica]|uniref:peptidyl-prolyl cis-trans isomerase FKBP13, chloroplastic-like n=1 Tax=Salvia hispanica TaxID=49212 RepID=UPI0020093288|nr:peptidyl-prolyl cis-trans isomerase FKBP13, chloroplastic-like [Salvia hispanica]